MQARSKARVEQILNAAEDLISKQGSDGLKMSAVAKQAAVPIGTVYQFFPNKSAIIQTLAIAVMEDVRTGLTAQFSGIDSLNDAADKVEEALRGYYRFLRSNPTVRDILCSTQGDKKLQQLDLDDSRKNGELLFDCLEKFVADSHHDQLRHMCFMNMHLTGSLVRLAVNLDPVEAEGLLSQFAIGLRNQIESLPDQKAHDAEGGPAMQPIPQGAKSI
ncbi:TetR family transcriptional regulator [Tateyamaria omphalii]|uniref:TetR/AcrR family transcriptional regulator n=1 Tax=Tateyamaria omphalii TaxID=299262 RepID=UPI001C9A2166|nr:TetR/AcrR family transcriptional regulator [Tateyamaria omphalii]MBY5934948.1 TetR family transcriptional regulator [Tateyamaria omphalii]